jgi:hypothetical protein
MPFRPPSQGVSGPAAPIVDTVIPNPKLKLLDQMREVMRLKHYSLRTERTYCDWVRRYVHFHQMQTREENAGNQDSRKSNQLQWTSTFHSQNDRTERQPPRRDNAHDARRSERVAEAHDSRTAKRGGCSLQ